MSKDLKNILLAVDGSDQSFEGLRYVGRILPKGRVRMTILHVMDLIPDICWGLVPEIDLRCQRMNMSAWEVQERIRIEHFQGKARMLLLSQGYAEEVVSFVVKEREAGVARDIAREAQKGYAALVLGRRGLSAVKDFIFGSTTDKLVGYLHNVPVWVVGGQPDPNKILIAVDRSEGAMRALDYVGDMFGNMHPELLLLHVTRGISGFPPGRESLTKEQTPWSGEANEEIEKIEKGVASFFRECIRRLEPKGADANRIRTQAVSVLYSPALAIFREARRGGYGTIVVGRRGISRTEEFIMGSVSSQVLQLAEEIAVWVVH